MSKRSRRERRRRRLERRWAQLRTAWRNGTITIRYKPPHVDPKDFVLRQSLRTRAATAMMKMGRPEFFGKIKVEDLT